MKTRPPNAPDTGDAVRLAFSRLIDLTETERATTLAQLSRDNPQLAAEIEALIAVDPQAATWFNRLEQSLGRGRAAELDAAWAPGRVIGPYRLERLLATGGMDAVFIARKADGELKRPVALKLVPPGLISNEAVTRLRRERDLLAGLSHPNIAALLDAGVTADGQPWFALELIDGLPLISWCQQQRLDVPARVRLLIDLAEAVAFAHRHLVVHGDLKPSNVLVDRDGRVRLLDFGIARLLREIPVAEKSALYLTPAYAAPEIRTGGPPSVAGDIYALGVSLHEMLAEDTTKRAAHRLPRELQAIVACATSPQPDGRYHSVNFLINDLRHYLDRLPVGAYSTSTAYRLGKWFRRHPWASSAALLALAALTAFALISRQQAERFGRERDKAEQLAGFMQSVFAQADPELARGKDLTARELLDRGVKQLASAPADPAVRADFLTVMGETYQRLGLYDEAGRLLHDAVEIYRAMPAGVPAELAAAQLRLAENHVLNGELADAENDFRGALELLRTAPDNQSNRRLTADALAKLGRTLGERGDPAGGLALLLEALEIAYQDEGVDSAELAERLNDTASANFRLGRYHEAELQLTEALAIRRRLDAQNPEIASSPRTATLLNNLGLMYYLSGKPGDAESFFQEALDLRRLILPTGHPDIAQTLTNLGLLYKESGHNADAVKMLREALAIRSAALKPDHVKIAQAQHNLAMAYQLNGDFQQAEKLFVQALSRLSEELGETHPLIATAHNDYGALLLEMEKLTEAERHYREALAIRRRILPDGHPYLAWSLTGLGRVLNGLGRPEEALPLLTEALEIRKKNLPADHPLLAETAAALTAAQNTR